MAIINNTNSDKDIPLSRVHFFPASCRVYLHAQPIPEWPPPVLPTFERWLSLPLAKVEYSFSTSFDPHTGHATSGEMLEKISLSNF